MLVIKFAWDFAVRLAFLACLAAVTFMAVVMLLLSIIVLVYQG